MFYRKNNSNLKIHSFKEANKHNFSQAKISPQGKFIHVHFQVKAPPEHIEPGTVVKILKATRILVSGKYFTIELVFTDTNKDN